MYATVSTGQIKPGQVAAFIKGLGGKHEVTESFQIGFFKRKGIGLAEIVPGELIVQALRECHGILDGQFHIR